MRETVVRSTLVDVHVALHRTARHILGCFTELATGDIQALQSVRIIERKRHLYQLVIHQDRVDAALHSLRTETAHGGIEIRPFLHHGLTNLYVVQQSQPHSRSVRSFHILVNDGLDELRLMLVLRQGVEIVGSHLHLLHHLLCLILLIQRLAVLGNLTFHLNRLLGRFSLCGVLYHGGNSSLSSQPRFGECLVECFECFRFSRLGIGHFGCIVLLFCLTDEFRKVFFCVLGFIRFFLFFVVTLNVIHSRIVGYATIRLRHVLILAADAVALPDLCTWQVGVQKLGGLQVLVLLLRHLRIEHVKDKIACGKQWDVHDGWQHVLRLTEVYLICYFHRCLILIRLTSCGFHHQLDVSREEVCNGRHPSPAVCALPAAQWHLSPPFDDRSTAPSCRY